jgi:hypothetical protein
MAIDVLERLVARLADAVMYLDGGVGRVADETRGSLPIETLSLTST